MRASHPLVKVVLVGALGGIFGRGVAQDLSSDGLDRRAIERRAVEAAEFRGRMSSRQRR